MSELSSYLPQRINSGPFVTSYSLPALQGKLGQQPWHLPICSLTTATSELAALGPLVLPPLYREAMDESLQTALVARISECFPCFQGTRQRTQVSDQLEVVQLPAGPAGEVQEGQIVAFSVDTAVEEHGPHLPLATDTIQSYGVLSQLAQEVPELHLIRPVDYGHLTWGLPFGMSVDITPELLTRYVTGFANAVCRALQPRALYVVDVHGSIVHREAIQEGLRQSECSQFAFRWLHEPLVEFAGERGDQHAGGVETVLVNRFNPALVDTDWWPGRIDELMAGQMDLATALGLSDDVRDFVAHVEQAEDRGTPCNGIVGVVENADQLDAELLLQRMLAVASDDLQSLGATLP
ncbi:MAG: creatininase family protein [Pirellulaceae bacterium]